jgi:dUTP pyrophosphatase
MQIKVINQSRHPLPAYQTSLSAGLDLRASLETAVKLKPLQRALIPTGLFIELPEGFEAQIRPRSGLAYKHGVTVLNSPGTIDADYRGEIKVILITLGQDIQTIHPGDRIAQMVFQQVQQVEWQLATEIQSSERGEGGFGHTGKQ